MAKMAALATRKMHRICGRWIVKIIFIVGLVKALQAALADQRESQVAAAAGDVPA